MEALLSVTLVFLPAIIYFTRSPYRPTHGDVLASLLGIWLGLVIVIQVGTWLLSERGAFWAGAVIWAAMCIYAWTVADAERNHRSERTHKRQ